MRKTFDFPRKQDLVLGEYGDIHGCGCLLAKVEEVCQNANIRFHDAEVCMELMINTMKQILGKREFNKLTHYKAKNTPAARTKAYNALVKAFKTTFPDYNLSK